MRPPSAMAPLGPPRLSVALSVATLFALPLGQLSGRVPAPAWDSRSPAPALVGPLPAASVASLGRSSAPYRRNKAWGGGGARAGLPPPQHGRVLPGPSDQDVARPGSSPAGTQGPGTGHQLPPVLRTRSPTAANTLVRGRTGKCALFSPAPQAWWVWTGAHGCPLSPVRI